MGLFEREKKGKVCQPNPDGTQTCQRFVIDKNGNQIATGSEWTIGADPSRGCQPVVKGRLSLMDGEKDELDDITKMVVQACKKGLA